MSKMDAMRAMREARYEAAKRDATKAAPAAKKPRAAARKPVPAEAVEPEETTSAAPDGDELCGHRAISGRTCTREKGHAAKSHRYS